MRCGLAPPLREFPLARALAAGYIETRWTWRQLTGRSTKPIDVTVAGTTASFRPRSAQEYHWIRSIEEGSVIADLVGSIEDGDVFWDVGANIGLVSCLVGKAADVEMIAFEPYPLNVQSLRQNLGDNSLSTRTTILEAALGSEEGTAELNVAVDWDTKHSLVNESDHTIPVPMKRGDVVASEHGDPDVVKIDVEGAEMAVLNGMTKTIDRCRRVYCEVHRVFGVDETSVRDWFQSRGFRVGVLAEDTKTTSLVATK